MIELTQEQIEALAKVTTSPIEVVNPLTKETFVLLNANEYVRLKEETYEDTPWSRSELQAANWEMVEHEDWTDEFG